MTKIIKISFLFLLCTIFTNCKPQQKNDKDTIMVTIEPLRYFTEQIVGDKFNVVSMVPKGSSPETYDPTPQQLIELSKSTMYFKIGYIGFEISWMDKIIDNTPNLKIIDTSEGINFIHAKGHAHGDHYHEGGKEPHIWNSTVNAKIITKNILKAVIELDSNNSDYYNDNYTLLIKYIEETDDKITQILGNEKAAKGFMIYHPALSYFARDYGLNQISIEEDGKEPTPEHLKMLILTSREQNIHTIFIQPEFDKKNAEVIANDTKSSIIPIEPLSYDWGNELIKTAQALIN